MNINSAIVKMSVRNWAAKNPHDRSAAARALANQLIAEGVRDEIAAALPPHIRDSFDHFVHDLRDWNG